MLRLALVFLIAIPLSSSCLEVDIQAPSAILINADSGAILFERNAEAPHYPASITKIATAFFLLEAKGDKLDERATASREAVAAISPAAKRKRNYECPSYWLEFGASHIGLKRGEEMELHDLLNGLMLASGNDAANVIAEHVSGTVPAFMASLNHRLQELGCTGTHFTNPHGLHHPDHVTTAKDMAVLTRAALQIPTFCQVVSARSAERPRTNLQEATTLPQFNKLVKPSKHYYPKAIGVKTGYTSDAGATLVAAAEDGERTLIAVLFGCESSSQRFQEATKLFEAAFNERPVKRRIVAVGPQPYTCRIEGGRGKLTTCIADDVYLHYYPSEDPQVKGVLHWEPNLRAPILAGTVVGEIEIVDQGGTVLQAVPLLAAARVPPSLSHALRQTWRTARELRVAIKVGALGGLLVFLLFLLRLKRRV